VYLSPVFPVPYGLILTPKVSTDDAPGARSPTGSVMIPAAPSAGVVTTPVPLAVQLFATCGDTVSQPYVVKLGVVSVMTTLVTVVEPVLVPC
jgi:hypothetical protein